MKQLVKRLSWLVPTMAAALSAPVLADSGKRSEIAGKTIGSEWKGHRPRAWTEAVPALRSDGTQVPGGCPIESPTGRFLYTARNPGTGLDIFANQRRAPNAPFELGSALPGPANDPGGANDFCPTPRPDGQLYFVSNRSGGCGSADILVAINDPATGWEEPINLGCEPHGPNTPGLDLSPSILETRWGTFLFFSTDYHTGNQDIYVSYMRPDGTFSAGRRLDYPINTEYDDRQPNVSQNGRQMVFASNRPSAPDDASGFDIFIAKRRLLWGPWRRATNLSETVPFETIDANETRPSLSFDGDRLYYGSGGVWVSERD